jgi:hypothetical protein
LCAHFFRRADGLLGEHGALGLIATKMIAQGDTRTTGLQHLVKAGGVIYNATRPMPWPGQADVSFAIVHVAKGKVAGRCGQHQLDGVAVRSVSSRLKAEEERSDPLALTANEPVRFSGCKIYGEGFILAAAERSQLIAKNPSVRQRIFPYLGGAQLNASPRLDYEEFVINFGQMTLEESSQWPELLEIVRQRVKPDRDLAKDSTADGAHRKKYWWQFAQPRPDLVEAIGKLSRCLAVARDPQHICFAFQPIDRVFNEKLSIVASAAASTFAILQSRAHVVWVTYTGRTTGSAGTVSYSTSDCFDTFPFPSADPRTVFPDLEAIGERLYTARAAYMVETSQGLTKTYNALKDPACTDDRILALRRLHEEMDRAVLATYGWSDVAVPPYCLVTEADRAAAQAFEDEVIDRLYLLNAARAREEQRLDLGTKTRGRPAAAADPAAELDPEAPAPAKPGKAKKAPAKQGKLF